jgi:hypothetical protein
VGGAEALEVGAGLGEALERAEQVERQVELEQAAVERRQRVQRLVVKGADRVGRRSGRRGFGKCDARGAVVVATAMVVEAAVARHLSLRLLLAAVALHLVG